ncbi:HIR complex subunit [Malassezia yamatoensis]|uniref:Protein HIR n=1 Tax=Malassezia yamatoensis TaxID=253288 RepID=A0AAJ5YTV3_9BASI|nr:HIR complex subunit [Malassezia yamatoensis]
MTVQITVPDWVVHRADNQTKRSTVYSVSVHPDGTRLATGGLDTKIRIWATSPILDAKASEEEESPRLLSTLARHTGAVLAVRWSHSGRYLASGSDDTVCFIWDLDASGMGGGMVFGSSETNLENWRPYKRLPAHESDVTDIAWSESDTYLGTVGLDSLAIVWSGSTFERLRSIRAHQGFIKSISFDPTEQFFATGSDDRKLKIWRTIDGGLEACITAPFTSSPSSTFFHRSSWTPDGANLIASNAMNGPVFVASVIKRLSWTSDVSLVGHENAVTVAACSPRLFRGANDSVSTIVALGSLDQSVSVWLTSCPRPLLVARDLFERGVMDLSWSSDGYTLYACSSDGQVASIVFTSEELGTVLPDQEVVSLRKAFGYVPKAPRTQQIDSTPLPARASMQVRPALTAVKPPAPGERLKQEITRNANGKRRIRPTLLAGEATPAEAFTNSNDTRNTNAILSQFPVSGGRTLGGEKRTASASETLMTLDPISAASTSANSISPVIQSILRESCELGVIDIRNATDAPCEIALLNSADQVQWVDFAESPCICVAGSNLFVAVALLNGGLIWYASRGPRLCSLMLGEPMIRLASMGNILAAVSTSRRMYRWNVIQRKALPGSIQLPQDVDILDFYVHTNGVPIVILSNGEALGLDSDKDAFRVVASRWLLNHSSASDPQSTAWEPVKRVEKQVNELPTLTAKMVSNHSDFKQAATLRHLEMRMTAAEMLESASEYRQAIHALAGQLAEQGIRNQAEELLRSLLGPIYFKPESHTEWNPFVCGMAKRELLSSILTVMSTHRALTELVQHVQTLLDAVMS